MFFNIYTDYDFINQVSSKLERFKKKSEKLFNFRCPFCKDSEKNKLKARGYFYHKNNAMFFRCHNCGEGMSLSNFLKSVDIGLYERYIFEKFKSQNNRQDNSSSQDIVFPSSKFTTDKSKTIISKYPKIDSLPLDYPAHQYLLERKIPSHFLSKMYLVSDFKKLVDELEPDNEHALKEKDTRIVIPFYDVHNEIVAIQGRSLHSKGLRYITIKLNKTSPKIFGMDRVDTSKRVYILEGPIDSMFLENAVATAGADLQNAVFEDSVFVFDNEPRNLAIINSMTKLADSGKKVCVWPPKMDSLKDVNDMVLAGKTPKNITKIIDENVFEGLKARIHIREWRKC